MEDGLNLTGRQLELLKSQDTWKELKGLARLEGIKQLGPRLHAWSVSGEVHFLYEELINPFIAKNKFDFDGSDSDLLKVWGEFYKKVNDYRAEFRLHNNGARFGQAVELLKQGYPVQRKGWNGKGLFIFMQLPATIDVGSIVPKMQSLPDKVKEEFMRRLEEGRHEDTGTDSIEFNTINYSNQMALVDSSNQISGWSPSSSDTLAEDWVVYQH